MQFGIRTTVSVRLASQNGLTTRLYFFDKETENK